MNVSLTQELNEYVEKLVQSGLYSSASEVIRDGLRLLKEREELKSAQLQQLRREISVGLDQLENGHGKTYTSAASLIRDVKAEGRKRRAARVSKKK